MRILFVSDTYYPHLNGVYYFVCRIAPLLKEKGHEVAVLAPSESTRFTTTVIDNIDVYGVPSLPVLYYPKVRVPIPGLVGPKVRQIVDEFDPEIIHIQDHFFLSRQVVRLAKRRSIPIVATNHFMPENLTSLLPSPKYKKLAEHFLWSRFSHVYNQVSLVTTPTETAARIIRPKLGVEVVAISSGIDLKQFKPVGSATNIKAKYSIPDRPILLFVGRLDPEKKLDEILRAVSVAAKKVDFSFVIVGRGLKMTALRQLSKELGIADRTIFTGFVPEADLPYIYRLSDCFIIASIAELLSLATLQAMACGLPVVAVNAGALGELVHDKENGFLTNAGDIVAMARDVSTILVNHELAKSMGRKSLDFVVEHDIQKSARSFENLYLRNVKRKLEEPQGV